MIRLFLELYAIHVLIATLFSYLLVPLLPKPLVTPYLRLGLSLRKAVYESIERIYDKKTIELYMTSRIFAPFTLFVVLNSFVLDFILSVDGLMVTQFFGWLIYGSLIVNSVPSVDEWDLIVKGDPLSWSFVWVKVAIIIDILNNPTLNLFPPLVSFIAIFFPFSSFLPEGETRIV